MSLFDRATNWTRLLRHRARLHSERIAFTFLPDGEREEGEWTYGELDRRARAVAAMLQKHRLAGERVLLLYADGFAFLPAFLGCLYTGTLAVPLLAPRPGRRDHRHPGVLADTRPRAALTTTTLLPSCRVELADQPAAAELVWLASDGLAEHEPTWVDPGLGPNALAYLQYTSGSTGTPRGVMLTHGNLLSNCAQIEQAASVGPDTVAVFWAPFVHNAGLIGALLQIIYSGGRCYLMPPAAFLEKPMRWLRAVSRYRATHSGGSLFGYEQCRRCFRPEEEGGLDLSSWRMASGGGEPIRLAALKRFSDTFAPYGFRANAHWHGYGLTEATLVVTGSLEPDGPIALRLLGRGLERHQVTPCKQDDPGAVTLVSAGRAVDGVRLEIVDPATRARCSPDTIGEIWVAGPLVARGYWGQEEATRDTFQGYLSENGAGPYLRTGDLGFLRDGHLYVTGRLKDLIILRGKNYYPQDIEESVEGAHPALRPNAAAAFAVEVESEERPVAVLEVERAWCDDLDLEEAGRAALQAVTGRVELRLREVVFVPPDAIPRTPGGKIQRQECRRAYLAGTLPVLGRWQAPPQPGPSVGRMQAVGEDALVQQVRCLVQQILNLPAPPDERTGFTALGIDSLLAVEFGNRVQALGGGNLPSSATLAFDYPNARVLGAYLAARRSGGAAPTPAPASPPADAIAVVGLACRFPGATDAEQFWRLLCEGRDAITEVPRDRWDLAAYYDPDPDAPGKMYARHGGFLDGLDTFDPLFFGISPREAASLDPQQRLLLEVCWHALESAGIPPSGLRGSNTGVFVGVSGGDFVQLLTAGGEASIGPYVATGTSRAAAAGRISYVLGLEGPCLALDTACSSSLVAVHQACAALRGGECDLALAGGVNVILSPAASVALCRARMLSPSGRCRPFDAGADGYARGEGCGVVVLRRLSDAQAAGDPILAVVRGSAVNQDGASGGLTVPNGPAQQRLIATALARAGLKPADVAYLEAHGTGTALGDPIEVQAAAGALGPGRDAARPLLLGSVKANLGHLETAAGVAGLIKVILALRRGLIPGQPHFREPNPRLPWDLLPVVVAAQLRPWPEGRRLAGVSSFGFSGTNAHVVLEAADPPQPSECLAGSHLLALSGRDEASLRDLAGAYAAWLADHPDADLADVCYTASAGRDHLPERAALLAGSPEKLRALCEAVANGRSAAGLSRGRAGTDRRTAWLFGGQGAQYAGMAAGLYDTEPVFQRAFDRCDEAVAAELDRPLREVIADGALLSRTGYAQPVLFAVQVALAELWRSWGLEPDAVLGHSLGQYAAACIAGVFSLEDGARLVARRGTLMAGLPPGGAMAAVDAPEAVVQAELARQPGLGLAADNGRQQVLSGPVDRLQETLGRLEAAGFRCRRLEVDVAFHSALLGDTPEALERAAREMEWRAPRTPLACNLTGELLGPDADLGPVYWGRHARQTVRFAAGVRALAGTGCSVLLDVGPQPVLLGLAADCWPAGPAPALVSGLRRGQPARECLLEALGQLYVAGAVHPAGPYRDRGRYRLPLPGYPFQRQRFWAAGSSPWPRPVEVAAHPVLGVRQRLADSDERRFEQRLAPARPSWLGDHRLFGAVVFPGAGYVEAALAAAETGQMIEQLSIEAPLAVRGECWLQTVLRPSGDTTELQIFSQAEGETGWQRHATARLVQAANGEPGSLDLDALRRRLEPRDAASWYPHLEESGVTYGPAFRTVRELWEGPGEVLARLELHESAHRDAADLRLAPGLLDGAWQSLDTLRTEEQAGNIYVPVGIDRVRLLAKVPSRAYAHGRRRATQAPATDSAAAERVFDLMLIDEHGQVVAELEGLRLRPADPRMLDLMTAGKDTDLLYHVSWQEQRSVTLVPPAVAPGTWVVRGSVPAKLAKALGRHGQRLVETTPSMLTERLLELIEDGLTPAGVLWRVESRAGVGAEPRMACRVELEALLGLSRTLLDRKVPLPSGLVLWTEGAVAVEPAEDVDAVQASLWGMGRTIAAEQDGCRLIDAVGAAPEALADLILESGGEGELALRGDRRFVARLTRAPDGLLPSVGDYRLSVCRRGALENLALDAIEAPLPGPGEVRLRVEAAGVNFRDLLNVLGAYPGDPGPLGGEAAGVVTDIGERVEHLSVGDAVFGFAAHAFATVCTTPARLLCRRPEGLDAAAAATVPVAFTTAELAFRLAGLKAGERVLIHAAAGGVGLAAVQLAQWAGAEIFATASAAKQHHLRALGVAHVYDSRSTAFGEQIQADTGGAGVDVVLNSLTSAGFIEASLRALGRGGRFVEIGKRDIWSAGRMAQARPDVGYHILAVDEWLLGRPAEVAAVLAELAGRLTRGELQPLPRHVYPLTAAPAALRRMHQARHVGKIVLAVGRAEVRADGAYLIIGGLGALGRSTAAWLAARGARCLVLVSRGEPVEAVRRHIRSLESEHDCQVHTVRADVADAAQVSQLVSRFGREWPPLRGVVHAAGVLEDGVLAEQNWDRFERVLRPKALGAWHLHWATAGLPLDFFVLYSSVAGVLGSAGQGGYAAANAFLDGLAQHRRAHGLPATSINWGPWAGEGMADDARLRLRWQAAGIRPIPPGQNLRLLEYFLSRRPTGGVVLSLDLDRFLPTPRGSRPLFAELGRSSPRSRTGSVGDEDQALAGRVRSATGAEQADGMRQLLRRVFAHELGLEPDQVPLEESLVLHGLDSLMLMGALRRLADYLGLPLYPREFYEHPGIADFASYLTRELNSMPQAGTAGQERGKTHKAPATLAAPPPPAPSGKRVPGVVLLLSAPRSGSTLLRVMLAGHPDLFVPPELHLLPFAGMAEWRRRLAETNLGDGLVRAWMELAGQDAGAAQRELDALADQDMPVPQVYTLLREKNGGRLLVDKSPTYASSLDILLRAEEVFDQPRYVWLVRHPYAVIESFVRVRMGRLLGMEENPYQVAEQIWAAANDNLARLWPRIEPSRRHFLRYEGLLADPEDHLRALCTFCGVDFNPAVLRPYEGGRMTDGVTASSLPIGDVHFLKRHDIDPTLADMWREIRLPHPLAPSTACLAAQLGYEVRETPPASAPQETARETLLDVGGLNLCLCTWGPEQGPAFLLLHGLLDQALVWDEVAGHLARAGCRVLAPDLRGHGRSSHAGPGGYYHLMDFVADLDALLRQLDLDDLLVVGHSLGAVLAAHLAAARTERVRRLVLVEPPLARVARKDRTGEKLRTLLDHLAVSPEHGTLRDVDEAAAQLRQAVRGLTEGQALRLARRGSVSAPAGVRWSWDARLRARTGLLADGLTGAGPSLPELLGQVEAKVTLVWGSDSRDRAVSQRQTLEAAAGQTVELTGGHHLPLEAPAELATVLLRLACPEVRAERLAPGRQTSVLIDS
jgi:myxalamid-type polyketide synthase MxaB